MHATFPTLTQWTEWHHAMDKAMAPTNVRDKLKDYAAEFCDLVRSGATKDQLRNGANGKHGINHLNELFMLLPDGPSAEFRIKE